MENKIYQGSLFRSSIPLMSCSIFKEQYMAWKKNIGGIRSGWLTPFWKKNHVFPPSQKIQNCLKLAQKRTQKKRTKRGLAVLLQLPTKLVLRKITKESFVLETLLVPGEESTTAGCLGGKVPVQLRAATSSVQRRRPTTLVALLPTFNFFALLSRHHEPRHLRHRRLIPPSCGQR